MPIILDLIDVVRCVFVFAPGFRTVGAKPSYLTFIHTMDVKREGVKTTS